MSQKLGQHWLKNKKALRTIVDSLELAESDVVVEVGPGRGALTDELEAKAEGKKTKIIAIEKDPQLAKELRERYNSNKNIQLVEGDALQILPEIESRTTHKIQSTAYKLVGNIPYYITGKLLRTITELKKPPLIATLTIQREVAQRLTAQPPNMNLLAAAIQFAADIEILMHLKPGDFSPPPKVRSSIIKLSHIKPYDVYSKYYYSFLHTAFAHPRKQLKNNLKNAYPKENIEHVYQKLNIPKKTRAQNLTVMQLWELSEELEAI